MALQSRYHLRVKRPTNDDIGAVTENVREVERNFNLLPIPDPQMFKLAGGTIPFTAALLESFTFRLAQPNTRIAADLIIDLSRSAAGGGLASTFIWLDGVPIDSALGARMNEAAIRASVMTGYATTVKSAGKHTLELHGNKTINAGTFDYVGALRLWVL